MYIFNAVFTELYRCARVRDCFDIIVKIKHAQMFEINNSKHKTGNNKQANSNSESKLEYLLEHCIIEKIYANGFKDEVNACANDTVFELTLK